MAEEEVVEEEHPSWESLEAVGVAWEHQGRRHCSWLGEEGVQGLWQVWEEDRMEYENPQKEEEHQTWTKMVLRLALLLEYVVEGEERQKR